MHKLASSDEEKQEVYSKNEHDKKLLVDQERMLHDR